MTAQTQFAGPPARIACALLAVVLSAWVVSVFLSHWSLLDGFPRNGLSRYLESKAEKPFAYRVLAPALVNGIDAMLQKVPEKLMCSYISSETIKMLGCFSRTFAKADSSSRLYTEPLGLQGDEYQIILVLGVIALRKFSGSSGSTKTTSTPQWRKVMPN